MCVQGGAFVEARGQIQVSSSGATQLGFLSQNPSLVLEITDKARLASKPIFQGWDHTCVSPYLAFLCDCWESNSGLHTFTASTLPPEPSPKLQIFVLLYTEK